MKTVDLKPLNPEELVKLSRDMLLSLSAAEMQAVKDYFEKENRAPTVMELEIIAQTWSEHCKHKTMAGIIEYTEVSGDDSKTEVIDNLLKETVFRATDELGKDYCLSVFRDNAGVINLDDENAIAMKVETHNHPSALEPYGGAATGIGGVIRDILGCGKGARPFLNIDVFCFGPADTSPESLPPGVMHPERIFKGVVRGVRDYGNRMGIPTASGAVLFDPGYTLNPLVFCGTLGIIPKSAIDKKVSPGELVVAVGGRTGRDGIHGATFSSIALDHSSDSSCVQIGDPITEKKFADALLRARDLGLYTALTDCGAGGFSSAIGEMGEETGVRARLESAPLKYPGLEPWEIFLSESQERMVLSVLPEKLQELKDLCGSEGVELSVLGEFTGTGRLEVFCRDEKHADISMDFLHGGVPRLKRKALWRKRNPSEFGEPSVGPSEILIRILSDPNTASKEEVIRQYDHEVQGGAVLRPLSGPRQDAPQDGCVYLPGPGLKTGVATGLGINPYFGITDPFNMALSCVDEAARNTVAAGGRIDRAALMDNFCWGDTSDEEVLGSLVRASLGCYEAAMLLGIPFVSGKDSLNNSYAVPGGETVSIPGTLLITCVAPVEDLLAPPGTDFKEPGNLVYIIGETYPELGGSAAGRVCGKEGALVPALRPYARDILLRTQEAINKKLLLSCHDLSEGGLAAAAAEMCFGGVSAEIDISRIPLPEGPGDSSELITRLFSESNSRFLVEVREEMQTSLEKVFSGMPLYRIGRTAEGSVLNFTGVMEIDVEDVRGLWKNAVRWHR